MLYLVTPTRDAQIWAEISDSVDRALMCRFILQHLTVKSIVRLLPLGCPGHKNKTAVEKKTATIFININVGEGTWF